MVAVEERNGSGSNIRYRVIDQCEHGTHDLEQELKLKGEPIKKTAAEVNVSRSLVIQIVMTLIFCLLEFITGVVCSSIAMLADSYHMAADVMALIVAFVCVKIATRPSKRNGYGWVRAETLGGFFNAIFMITVCTMVMQEGVGRLLHVQKIAHPLQVLVIGGIGLLINVYGMFNLDGHGHSHGGGGHGHGHGHSHSHGHSHGGKDKKDKDKKKKSCHGHGHSHSHATEHIELTDLSSSAQRRQSVIETIEHGISPYGTHLASDILIEEEEEQEPEQTDVSRDTSHHSNLNIRGVWLHLLSDALGSVIVMMSAGFVYFLPDWTFAAYLDPLLSMGLAAIMAVTAVLLVTSSARKLLKLPPVSGFDEPKVRGDLVRIAGVVRVDQLSVWELSARRVIARVHVTVCHPAIFADVAIKIKTYFHDIGVHSTTIEPEFEKSCMESLRVEPIDDDQPGPSGAPSSSYSCQ